MDFRVNLEKTKWMVSGNIKLRVTHTHVGSAA